MTVPAVPNRSMEHLERGAFPFRAFPLPLGGNVWNAGHSLSRDSPIYTKPPSTRRN